VVNKYVTETENNKINMDLILYYPIILTALATIT